MNTETDDMTKMWIDFIIYYTTIILSVKYFYLTRILYKTGISPGFEFIFFCNSLQEIFLKTIWRNLPFVCPSGSPLDILS